MSITIKSPDYFETCKNAYLAKTTAVAHGANTYDTPFGVDTIKKVGESEQRETKTITASGKVFKQTSKHSATNLGIDATSLPADFVRWALDHASDTNGGFGFVKSSDTPTEFAFGSVYEYSDKSNFVFKWYPRCVLSNGDKTVQDPGTSPTDPSTSYTVVALPYGDDNIIAIEYDTTLVSVTKNPLTETQFFTAVLSTLANALVGTETTKA